ncbi:MAG: SurA N-terminal domain-containing protein [Nakamurella sp.]
MLSARRILTTVAGVGIVGLIAAGCATSATAAAQVGDVSISEADIFNRSAAVVSQYESSSQTTADTSAVSTLNRSQTTTAIRSQLLAVAAGEQGVVVTDAQVNEAIASAGSAGSQPGASQSTIEATFRDLLTVEGLISRQSAGVPITDVKVRIEGISVPTRDEAVATRSQFLSDPSSVDAAIATAKTPVNPAAPISLLAQPTSANTGIFNAKPGDVILFPSSDGYYVLRIVEHTQVPAVLTINDLASQKDVETVLDLGSLALQPVGDSTGVSVNPRLGVWDPLSLQVVPGGSGL